MASQALSDLSATVEKATTVEASAEALITGFASRLQAAIDAAMANGATAEEIAPVSELGKALDAESDALAAAVALNTPQQPN